jgi:hypothetical protein
MVDAGETVTTELLPRPPDQRYVPEPEAVRVVLVPVHIVVAPLIAATGDTLTLTWAEALLVQPFTPVTVTVYIVVDTGETVTAGLPPSPPDQRYVPEPEAVSVVLLPAQIIVAPLITVTGG